MSDGASTATLHPSPQTTGDRLRRRRGQIGLSLRELARRVGVSASTISQIERGLISPSVATLYAIVRELEMSLDELFATDPPAAPVGEGPPVAATDAAATARDQAASPTPDTARHGVRVAHGDGAFSTAVVRRDARPRIVFSSGVEWERLAEPGPPQAEFLHVVYPPGSTSSRTLMRHTGREFGHVLSGRLEVTLGFDRHVLEAGDSIVFDCAQPHRLAALGDDAAHAIWFVAESDGDPRFQHD